MKAWASVFAALATQAAAEDVTCALTLEACVKDCVSMSLAFSIDTSQFSPPQNPDDPPRRQVTTVTSNDATFPATAIRSPDGVRGFYVDDAAQRSQLLIVEPEGPARLVIQPERSIWVGQCRIELG